ncbi:MAG: hypothetical protein JRM72_05720 [Nitrososphaerota archaeon]|nr:hypothetical protein [Nitrososphaerota archaeon]
MINMVQPKARYMRRLDADRYLSVSIWAGRTHPEDEIIRVQIRKRNQQDWQTESDLSIYRTAGGVYTELKPREQSPSQAPSAAPR